MPESTRTLDPIAAHLPPSVDESIGKRVRNLREKHGLSQLEMGRRLGMVQATVSGIELGQRKLLVSELISLADLFASSTDAVLGRRVPDHSNELARLRMAVSSITSTLESLSQNRESNA